MSKWGILNINLPAITAVVSAAAFGINFGAVLSTNRAGRSYENSDDGRRVRELQNHNRELEKQLQDMKSTAESQRQTATREALDKAVEAEVHQLLGTEQKWFTQPIHPRYHHKPSLLDDLREESNSRIHGCGERVREYSKHPTPEEGKAIIHKCSCASLSTNEILHDIVAASSPTDPLTTKNEAMFLGALSKCYYSPTGGDGWG